nr:uncharacterized mitochondrial protein AtMg00810-like [Tanacetum cinerariifolium]
AADATIRKEVAEYKQIFDDLDAEYERCVLENKNLKIEKKNLLIKNDCLIAECLEKDICSIVLSSNLVVPPSLNSLDCTLVKLRTNCDREHSKVLELEAEVLKRQHMLTESEKRCSFLENEHVNLQLKFQKYKECLQSQKRCDSSNYTASNAIFEINRLKDQLQGKDETIRNLQAQHDIMSLLNVGPTDGRKALETELTQLKDTITALRIQNNGFKVTNATQITKIAKLKAKDVGNKSSRTTTPTNPKVLALGMYAIGPNPPPTKLSPLVDDDVGEEEAIRKNTITTKSILIKHKYSMGMVDNTLFTKKSKSHLIIVQIYVDDIIFGSTSKNLCDDFVKIMHDDFEMSMMGELNFFLGLQIKQMEDGIFFNQSKYVKEMLKKFGLEDSKPTKTPMSMEIKLTKDNEVDSPKRHVNKHYG